MCVSVHFVGTEWEIKAVDVDLSRQLEYFECEVVAFVFVWLLHADVLPVVPGGRADHRVPMESSDQSVDLFFFVHLRIAEKEPLEVDHRVCLLELLQEFEGQGRNLVPTLRLRTEVELSMVELRVQFLKFKDEIEVISRHSLVIVRSDDVVRDGSVKLAESDAYGHLDLDHVYQMAPGVWVADDPEVLGQSDRALLSYESAQTRAARAPVRPPEQRLLIRLLKSRDLPLKHFTVRTR